MATILSTKEILLDAVTQTLGEDALETIKPSDAEVPKDGSFEAAEPPMCITQRVMPVAFEGGPTDILVGLDGIVPRWTPGSIIKWAAWRAGFASQEDADFAAEQLNIAAETWNKANIGVTFEWVPLAKDATFVLVYGGAMGTVLASAFFPNKDDLSYVYTYSMALKPAYKGGLWRVFLHELGHVLGLRHEFAIAKEGKGAIRLDDPNEMSVMNYRKELPELQESDIVSTRNFYALRDSADGNPPKVGMTDVVDFDPR